MILFGAVAGAVAGWFGHQIVVKPKSKLAVDGATVVHSELEPDQQATKLESHMPGSRPVVQSNKAESRAADSAGGGETPLYSKKSATLLTRDGLGSGASTEDEPERVSEALAKTPARDDLRDSVGVRCIFGPGNGGHWPDGKLTVGGAAWQGGPVDFQSINYDAGTAVMVGQVTRTPTGEVPATITTSDSDITFTGRAANGTLAVVSIFGEVDNSGHHTAVMSLHDGKYELDIAQFYGACDSSLKNLNNN
jgi:hypothetical protein